MSRLNVIEKIVLQVLEESPTARQDDYILMLKVCEKVNPEALNLPFRVVMKHHHFNMPNWESVTRCRRRIFEKRPDLEPPVSTRRKRRKAEEEYREYAKS